MDLEPGDPSYTPSKFAVSLEDPSVVFFGNTAVAAVESGDPVAMVASPKRYMGVWYVHFCKRNNKLKVSQKNSGSDSCEY